MFVPLDLGWILGCIYKYMFYILLFAFLQQLVPHYSCPGMFHVPCWECGKMSIVNKWLIHDWHITLYKLKPWHANHTTAWWSACHHGLMWKPMTKIYMLLSVVVVYLCLGMISTSQICVACCFHVSLNPGLVAFCFMHLYQPWPVACPFCIIINRCSRYLYVQQCMLL